MRSLVKASLARDDLLGIDTGLAGRLHGLMLRRVDACVGISRELVGEFRDAGIAPDRIDHIPNGVDLTRFQPLAPERVAPLRERLGLPTVRPFRSRTTITD